MRRSVIMGVSLLLFLIPIFGADAAIVPQCPATGCRACDLVTLANNVIKFLIQMSVLVAVGVIVIIGFKSVVGQGGSGVLGPALINIAIGMGIMLSGWLVVDTVMKVLVGGRLGPWNTIECIDNSLAEEPRREGMYTPAGVAIDPRTGARFVGQGDCSPERLGEVFGQQHGAIMSCIAQRESTCNVGSLSGVDRTTTGNLPFSVGLFQVNLTVHDLNEPECRAVSGGQALNCTQAFTGRNRDAVVQDRARYDMCVRAAQNSACNIAVSQRLLQTRSGYNHWTTYRGCQM